MPTNLVTNGQPQNDAPTNLLRAVVRTWSDKSVLCVMADKEDNRIIVTVIKREGCKWQPFSESAFSQAVDLLERSVSLLKESSLERNVSSPLEEHQGQRALANYRLVL